MAMTEFSLRVRDALVEAFPQFQPFVHLASDEQHIEIRFPHTRAPLELIIRTENDEISVFLGNDHRHVGMCHQLPLKKQIEDARQLIGGILSGAVPLVRNSKHPGLWIDEDRSSADYPHEGEITYTTWNDLGS